MSTAQKKANTRKIIAIVFFVLGAINILMKVTGLSELDTSAATNISGVKGIQIGYYAFPVVCLVIGAVFWSLYKAKLLEASYEKKEGS